MQALAHLTSYPLPPLAPTCSYTLCFSSGIVSRHRRLGWAHSLGNVTIRAKYQKQYDLAVTTLQVVFDLFVSLYLFIPVRELRGTFELEERF